MSNRHFCWQSVSLARLCGRELTEVASDEGKKQKRRCVGTQGTLSFTFLF